MKTLKELHERGTGYLFGYTDALADLADRLVDDPDHPELYAPDHTQVILDVIIEYFDKLIKEEFK